jgi:propionyl-CoA synthetase
MGRTDDIINVAGHRLSTGAMEEVLAGHQDVAECAVVGVFDALKGQIPLGLLVLKRGATRPHNDIVNELIQMVREKIGPIASFKVAIIVNQLPKTRSGKIVRGAIKRIADGTPDKVLSNLDDPSILCEIRANLAAIGYPRGDETNLKVMRATNRH